MAVTLPGMAPVAPAAAGSAGRARTGARDAAAEAERALVERARRGDEEAFRMLVDLHRDRAYGLALRITRSRTDAEDVAQEGFVRAWLALPRFRGESSFGTWLHRIVARRALDRAAALKTRRGREAPLEAAGQVASDARDAGAHGLTRRFDRMLGELGEVPRAVVTLFYYEGRSVEQVASALDMPTGTVKTHLSRARAVLREAWLREERNAAPGLEDRT
jgi:RNA polymerase sigma-70 factor (ECF subfamily)